MNRPNIDDYKLADGGYSQKYITDLEKHCNELEKALDAACKFISGIFNDHEDEKIYWEKECWKEWLMNDE